MKKYFNLSVVLTVVILLFAHHENVVSSIICSITLFEKKMFPSLFPFMVISPFFINYGGLELVKKLLRPLMKIFYLSSNSAYVLIMSMISGFPGGAIYAKDLYEQKIINKDELEQLILFCHFSNPLFILTVIPYKPFLVLICHYLTSIFIGIIYRKKIILNNNKIAEVNKYPFFTLFKSSIKKSIDNSLFILGVISFFFMLTALFNNPISNMLFEISQSINYINLNFNDLKLKTALLGFILSFGCFSVHLQTYGTIADLNISYLKYLKARLLHALLTFIIIFLAA